MSRFGRVASLLLLAASMSLPGWRHPASAAAKTVASTKHAGVVALLLTELNSRWVRDYVYLKRRLKSLNAGVVLYVYNAVNDPVRQLGQAEEALTKGAKVLIVVAASPAAAAAIVTTGHRSGAKVIAYDHTIRSRWVDLFDSFDAAAVGKIQASWLDAHVRRGSAIVTVNGPKGASNSQVFQKSYDSILRPKFRSHYFLNGGGYWTKDWSSPAAARAMGIALRRNHSRVQGVVAATDDLADGVISSLELVGSQGRTRVTGQGATVSGLRHILDGEQSMTAYEPVYDEAYAAAAATNAFLRGKRLSSAFRGRMTTAAGIGPAILFRPVVITRHNIKKAFDDGHVTKKEVCQGAQLKKLCAGL